MNKDEKLNMDLFSDEPIVDMTGDENIDYLFKDDDNNDDEIITSDLKKDEEKEQKNTNEKIQISDDSEKVIGKEDDTEDDDSTNDDVDNDSSNSNLFNSLTKLLVEKGLLSSEDSDLKIETEDDFVDLFKKQIKTSEYSDLNDLQKEYLKNIRDGIPHQKIEKDFYELNKLESIDEDSIKNNVELRHRIIYQDLINNGFSEERASKNLKRSIELDMDVEDSMEALESIKNFNKKRIEKENIELKNNLKEKSRLEDQRISSIKKRINDTDEIIKNFKITDSIKEKIQKNMFTVVGENPETKQKENSLMKYRRENPEDFEHKLYYLFTISNGFKNFDSIVKNTNSKVLKDLEKAVRSSTIIKDPGSPAYLQDPESYSIDIAGHELVTE